MNQQFSQSEPRTAGWTFLLQNQRGSILIFLIVILVVLSTLMIAMMHQTTTATFNKLFANRQERAYYLAEAGGRYGMQTIEAGGDPTGTYTLGQGETFTLSKDEHDGNVYLSSQGVVSSGAGSEWLDAKAKLTYRIGPSGYGIFAGSPDADAIRVSGGTCINVTGEIGSNGGRWVQYPALLNSFTDQDWDLYAGLPLPASPLPPSYPAPTVIPDIIVSTYGQTQTISAGSHQCANVTVSNGGTTLILDGTAGQLVLVVTDTLRVSNGAHLIIQGDVILVPATISTASLSATFPIDVSGAATIITDDMTFGNSARLDIAAGSTLTVFVNNTATFCQNSRVNTELPSATAEQLIIYGTPTCSLIKFTNSSHTQSLIYAPSANFDFAVSSPSSSFSGTFICNRINIANCANIVSSAPPSSVSWPLPGTDLGPVVQYFD